MHVVDQNSNDLKLFISCVSAQFEGNCKRKQKKRSGKQGDKHVIIPTDFVTFKKSRLDDQQCHRTSKTDCGVEWLQADFFLSKDRTDQHEGKPHE